MKRSPSALVAAATLIGTSIEWYDFYIYGLASALVFPALFFPKSDPIKFSAGASWVLSLYLMSMAAISLVSIWLIPETSGVDLIESAPLPALEYAG